MQVLLFTWQYCTVTYRALTRRQGVAANVPQGLGGSLLPPPLSFVESDHLDGDVDMYAVVKALLRERERRKRSGECKGEDRQTDRERETKNIFDQLCQSCPIPNFFFLFALPSCIFFCFYNLARVRLPLRPDHGHRMLDDLGSEKDKRINPG